MRTIKQFLFLLLAATIGLSTWPAHAGLVYSYTQIGVPGTTATLPQDINDQGQIVGGYFDPITGNSHGFLLDSTGFHTFDYPGAASTFANGITNSGQVVGTYFDNQGQVGNQPGAGHGYVLSNGVISAPIDAPGSGTPGTFGTFLYRMNDSGAIVGGYFDANNVEHGLLYAGGHFTTIDAPGGVQTELEDINSSGVIVGEFGDAAGISHGFTYSAGQFTQFDLSGPDAVNGTALYGINDAGVMIGQTLDANGYSHGFTYSDGVVSPLLPPFGLDCVTPLGINNLGQVVGYTCEDGIYIGFLATPVPEPATLSILSEGVTLALCAGVWARRRRWACRPRGGA
jgi:probable HAF family extracellular repeat protein